MIAHDTGYMYVDEKDIGIDSLYYLCMLFQSNRRFVVQCPALCRHVHMFGEGDTAIILMRRSIQDIMASQERIDWRGEQVEMARYDLSGGKAAEEKYRFWEEYQQAKIAHAFEIDYESLAGHVLWIAKEHRSTFGPMQTTLDSNELMIDRIDRDVSLVPYPEVRYWRPTSLAEGLLLKTGQAKLLNETGCLVWSLCDGSHTRDDMLQALMQHFDGVEEDVLAHDLDEFIEDLVKEGFLLAPPMMKGSDQDSDQDSD